MSVQPSFPLSVFPKLVPAYPYLMGERSELTFFFVFSLVRPFSGLPSNREKGHPTDTCSCFFLFHICFPAAPHPPFRGKPEFGTGRTIMAGKTPLWTSRGPVTRTPAATRGQWLPAWAPAAAVYERGRAQRRRHRQRRHLGRRVATWTVSTTSEPSIDWASTLAWEDQRRPSRAMPEAEVPEPSRDLTLNVRHPSVPVGLLGGGGSPLLPTVRSAGVTPIHTHRR